MTPEEKRKHIDSGGMECPVCDYGLLIPVATKQSGMSGEFRRQIECINCGAEFVQVYKLKRVEDNELSTKAKATFVSRSGESESAVVKMNNQFLSRHAPTTLGPVGDTMVAMLARLRAQDSNITGLTHRVLGSIYLEE